MQTPAEPGAAAFRRISPDLDGDGVVNFDDDCLFEADPAQGDVDADGIGDVCEDNVVPRVSAGSNLVGRISRARNLRGTVRNPSDVADLVVTSWSYWPIGGTAPGARCDIADPSALRTTIRCDVGRYRVRLSATDGNTRWVFDDILVRFKTHL